MRTQRPIRVSAHFNDPNYAPLHSHLTSLTFHGFTDLPVELQMHIFTLAAGTLSLTETYELFFLSPIPPTSRLSPDPPPSLTTSRCKCNPYWATRRKVMETCRLVRLMMFGQWRRDIVKADEWVNGGLMTVWPADMTAIFLKVYEPKKTKVNRRMEKLIEDVKGWLEGIGRMIELLK